MSVPFAHSWLKILFDYKQIIFQDFISNFILTEEAFGVYERKMEEKKSARASGSSVFGDVLFFSGSIAAVAGTILYLSERTRFESRLLLQLVFSYYHIS